MSLFKYFKRTATTSASSIGMNLKDSESENSECVNCNDSGRARIDFSKHHNIQSAVLHSKDQVKRKQAKEFKAEWKKTREWLVYLPGNGMFCSLCQKYDLILYLWVTFDPVFYNPPTHPWIHQKGYTWQLLLSAANSTQAFRGYVVLVSTFLV